MKIEIITVFCICLMLLLDTFDSDHRGHVCLAGLDVSHFFLLRYLSKTRSGGEFKTRVLRVLKEKSVKFSRFSRIGTGRFIDVVPSRQEGPKFLEVERQCDESYVLVCFAKGMSGSALYNTLNEGGPYRDLKVRLKALNFGSYEDALEYFESAVFERKKKTALVSALKHYNSRDFKFPSRVDFTAFDSAVAFPSADRFDRVRCSNVTELVWSDDIRGYDVDEEEGGYLEDWKQSRLLSRSEAHRLFTGLFPRYWKRFPAVLRNPWMDVSLREVITKAVNFRMGFFLEKHKFVPGVLHTYWAMFGRAVEHVRLPLWCVWWLAKFLL